MKVAEATLEHFEIAYPLERIVPLDQVIFLDIETTGFTANASHLYLIGCAYYQGNSWHTIQWFAENYEDEIAIIDSFFNFLKDYKYIIHFNGNQFDLPYISAKCKQLELSYSFDGYEGIDLYRRVSPYKFFLKLPNCKQKTIEKFLDVERKDIFSGGELIEMYNNHVKTPSAFSENALLLHNADDLKGMLSILPILSYYDLFNSKIKAKKAQANYYQDMHGKDCKELLITLSLPTPLPVLISASANKCYFRGEGEIATLKVPIYDEELKYFYPGYKDYYYLPEEDIALHKSVSSCVDKAFRIPATAATCYTRKQSYYLPQWENLFEPVFVRDYKGKEMFFELTDEMKRNREGFALYASHLLAMLASNY